MKTGMMGLPRSIAAASALLSSRRKSCLNQTSEHFASVAIVFRHRYYDGALNADLIIRCFSQRGESGLANRH